jgi:hypothetical protein
MNSAIPSAPPLGLSSLQSPALVHATRIRSESGEPPEGDVFPLLGKDEERGW